MKRMDGWGKSWFVWVVLAQLFSDGAAIAQEKHFQTFFNARNQITERRLVVAAGPILERIQYFYDANGNLIEQRGDDGEVTRYRYDALDRLLQIDPHAGTTTQFRYGPGDLPIARIRGGQETRYHYDGERLILETNVLGHPVRQYTYSPAGLLVSSLLGSVPHHRSAHLDAQSSPVALTTSLGNVHFRARFDPYGVEYAIYGERDQAIGFHGYLTSLDVQLTGAPSSAAAAVSN